MSLNGVEAFLFDVFGTVVDWRGSVVKELQSLGKKLGLPPDTHDWDAFAAEWRQGYLVNTRKVAQGGKGKLNVDAMHREILDDMLSDPQWSALGESIDESERERLNLVWHRLQGWPDSVEGLYLLKKHAIIATLSNGNVRLLADMAKHANLPWDVIFSSSLFGSYKPHPDTYNGALVNLSLLETPEKCAMVAAHITDLRAAAKVGMKTVYIPRPGEEWETDLTGGEIKSKEEGGEVDIVVRSFIELGEILAKKGS